MISESDIQQAVARILDAAPGSRVIVFGSHARHDARPDSDLDLLVVQPQVHARREEMARLTDVLRPMRIPVDIVVISRQTYDEWSDTPGTIVYEAAREGRSFGEMA